MNEGAAAEFARALEALRLRSGLSFADLGPRAFSSRAAVHRFCKGDALPREHDMVLNIATACGATPDELTELVQLWKAALEPEAVPDPEPDPVREPGPAPSPAARGPSRGPRAAVAGVALAVAVGALGTWAWKHRTTEDRLDPAVAPAAPAVKGCADLFRVPEADYPAALAELTRTGNRPAWVDAYEVGGKTYVNAILTPSAGAEWEAPFGLTADGYQDAYQRLTRQGFRPLHVESYLSGGALRFAPIFVKGPGPEFYTYHAATRADHDREFRDRVTEGFRPVDISVVAVSGRLRFTALYERRDVGRYAAWSGLTPDGYQAEFSANADRSTRLVYLDGYTDRGRPMLSAIWQYEPPVASFSGQHGITAREYGKACAEQGAAGRSLQVLTGYEAADGSERFAAYWAR